ncbi:MAG: class I SAM-dependent methyltransferase [Candidatus Diapherotrites archaeon]|nr:class I SAM-dependent methyltransferase [Candidatus Diapherotrites archaeon]
MKDYEASAQAHLKPQQRKAEETIQSLLQLLREPGLSRKEINDIERSIAIHRPLMHATVSNDFEGHRIVREIAQDFHRTAGLRVFGFGAGYGQVLFFLKNFMKAKVRGVDLGKYSREMTQKKKLGVIHEREVNSAELLRLGKFDVTYSMKVFETGVLTNKIDAIGMMNVAARITKKGGKSYHLIQTTGRVPLTRKEIEERGFRIDQWENDEDGYIFIKLTKISD